MKPVRGLTIALLPRYAYILTPKGAAEKAAVTGSFLQHKMREYEALKAEIEVLQHEAKPKVSKRVKTH